jgi:hypothetical protein
MRRIVDLAQNAALCGGYVAIVWIFYRAIMEL